MIRINLLPWREAQRAELRRVFFLSLALAAVIGAVVAFLGWGVLSGYLAVQQGRNDQIKREIVVLDKKIEEIKGLREQTDALLARKRVIESLQANRSEVVHLFNTLAKDTPEGIYLVSVRQSGDKIVVRGFAQTQARISNYMRALDDSELLDRPELVESKAMRVNNRDLFDFSLNVYIVRKTTEGDKDKKKPGDAK